MNNCTKKYILVLMFFYLTYDSFAQNKNISIGIDYGSTKINSTGFWGSVISPQLNYHFLKEKRANLTTSVFLNSYNTKYLDSEIALFEDGTPYIKDVERTKKGAAFGIGLSSQIKLFDVDNKLVPFIQPQLNYLRESVDENLQTFGQMIGNQPKPKSVNGFSAEISVGFTFNKQLQFVLFYNHLISEQKNGSLLPNYSLGFNLSYLFNIPFLKKETEKNE